MALTATLYRFQIELSDVDRGVYDTLDFRVAQHPSEGIHYMLTRILAYAFNWQEGLVFDSAGLSDPDASAISVPGKLLIEIGNPSPKKLHKGMKAVGSVRVYTYKNPENLFKDIAAEKVHRSQEIEIFSLSMSFLDELATTLKKDNRWGLLVNEGNLSIQSGEVSVSGEVQRHGPPSA